MSIASVKATTLGKLDLVLNNLHSCNCCKTFIKTCVEEHDHKRRDEDLHSCNCRKICREHERRDQGLHGCSHEEMRDDNRDHERRDGDIHGCGHEETCDEHCCDPERKDGDHHDCGHEEMSDKYLCDHKRRDRDGDFHGYRYAGEYDRKCNDMSEGCDDKKMGYF